VPKSKSDLPLGPIPDLLKWWKKAGVKGFVIGGLAVAIHTRARSTKDVDAVILLDDDAWAEFLELGKSFSFFPRYSDALDFARRSRVFLLNHKPSKIDIDLAIGALPFEEEAIRRVQFVKVGRLSIPVATVEDLIIMKAVSNRPQDRSDIVQMLGEFRDIDRAYVRGHLSAFAAVLDEPGLSSMVDDLLVELKREEQRKGDRGAE
jgi:predicted nucleotidyltransferase